jgi:hypothetical protein
MDNQVKDLRLDLNELFATAQLPARNVE